MSISEQAITLENLKEGAAIELFNEELKKVLENLNDENTTDAMRKVDLSVKLKPDKESREFVTIDMSCKSTLAPNAPVTTRATLTIDEEGDPELNEILPQKQLELGGFGNRRNPAETAENVTEFPKANEA